MNQLARSCIREVLCIRQVPDPASLRFFVVLLSFYRHTDQTPYKLLPSRSFSVAHSTPYNLCSWESVLNDTLKGISQNFTALMWNVEPIFASWENEHFVPFLKFQFASHHENAHRWFLNVTSIGFVSYVKNPTHTYSHTCVCMRGRARTLPNALDKFRANLRNSENRETGKEMGKSKWVALQFSRFKLQFFWSNTNFNGKWVFKKMCAFVAWLNKSLDPILKSLSKETTTYTERAIWKGTVTDPSVKQITG